MFSLSLLWLKNETPLVTTWVWLQKGAGVFLSFNHIFKRRLESAQQEGKLQTGGESKKAEEEGLYTTVPVQEADIYHLGELQELVSGILTASFCFMQHAACRGTSTELNPLC